ncbi:DUF885 domain-containing protein [Sphingomonas sabuli]|uniref:DUF885 domain-containing protein n=1 Tax=Sphingomonas sabuli TaxID=2764186 RepID=A0A7G9L4Q5_9SPHN|nr:DUF885 family protein [Sphingomonas sabuli]QNM83604.1 DUF885 domain-containing protein [Sphingomonas sabuli]
MQNAVITPMPAAAVPVAAATPPATVHTEAEATALLDAMAENLLQVFPERATTQGIDTGARAALRSELTDLSPAGQRHIADVLRADLARAQAFDTTGLSFETRTNFEVVRSAYATALEGYRFPFGEVAVGSWRNAPYVVIQNAGAYLDVPRFLDSDHPVKTAADAEAYLSRLQAFARQLDGELERLRSARAMGMVPPRFLIDKALKQLDLSAKGARSGGGLVDSLASRAKKENIPGDWAARARTIVTGEIAPALERQIAELQAQRAVATDEAGMWARPMGSDYYRWAAKASTTTTMSPDEIHQLGLDTLARLHAEEDVILKQLGYADGPVGERMKKLAKDPRFKFAETDAGRKELIDFLDQRIAAIRAKTPEMFNTLVRGNVEVRRLPPEEEEGAAGAYGGAGSRDGTVPGRFWINLKPGFDHRRYNLPTLTHHEAIPGHVWQGEYEHKLPLIRSLLSFNAYSEGWALYSEQLADEFGVYADDPVGRLGYLDSIAFRAARLVVDTGIHHKRWTRQQARDFFDQALGDPNESEVDRYLSWPGQALGYEMGHQEIDRQRTRAKTALGDRFDIKAFNDTVLLGGNVPLDVLAKNVDAYIAQVKAQ